MEAAFFCRLIIFAITIGLALIAPICQFMLLKEHGLSTVRAFDAESSSGKSGLEGKVVVFESRPNFAVRKLVVA
jgi:hypothetical protein